MTTQELPAINPCRITGSPAVLQTRDEFHSGDTLEKHMDRYGMSLRAIGAHALAGEIAKGFYKENPAETQLEDFRITATVGQNATGWKHPIHPKEEIAKHIPAEIIAQQRQKMIAEAIEEWNAANPPKV